jgi:hypothetical protein
MHLLIRATIRVVGYLTVFCILTGCAGTKVREVSAYQGAANYGAPRTVAVVTEIALNAPPRHETVEAQHASAVAAGASLTATISDLLASRALTVVPPDAHPDLFLRNRIVDLRTGNRALRLWVGYGAGKAELQVDTVLENPNQREPLNLLSFQSVSTSGGMPSGGLIGPALRSLSQDGLDKEVAETSDAIDKELGKYFGKQGWPYASRMAAPHRGTTGGGLRP